jgi:20S proteasome alpha/beta subunit
MVFLSPNKQMQKTENKNTSVGTKSLGGVVVGNHKESKVKIVMRQNSNQA